MILPKSMILQIAIILAILALLPYTVSMPFAFDIIVFGLSAIAYNIMLGYVGYLSFGHAAFFGIGVYGTGLALRYLTIPRPFAWISILIGLALALVAGTSIGAVAVKRGGAYFALTTMAFGETLHFTLLQFKEITGGDDGLLGIPRPFLGNSEPTIPQLYYISLTVFAAAFIFLRLLTKSHFGKLLLAVRDNEERLKFLGYNPYRIKLAAFIISTFFTALAGSFYVIYLRYAGLGMVSWVMSGDIVFMSILGGTGTFHGPLLGTVLYTVIRDYVNRYTRNWPLIMGVALIVIMVGARRGILDYIVGKLEKRWGRRIDV